AGALSACAANAPLRSAACKSEVAAVEGVYALQEWTLGGALRTPPAVDGRYIMKDGAVITILEGSTNEGNKVSGSSWGDYVVADCRFSYRYTRSVTVFEAPDKTTVSRKLPFEETRVFEITTEGTTTIFRSAGGKQELTFTPGSLKYSEDGKVQ